MASHYRGSRGQGRQMQREHGENLAPDRLIPSLATGWDLAAGPEFRLSSMDQAAFGSTDACWNRSRGCQKSNSIKKAVPLLNCSLRHTHFVTSDPILLLYTWMV